MKTRPKTPDPRTERVATDYCYRAIAQRPDAPGARVLWEGPNMAEGQVVASREGDRARRAGSDETVALDAFILETRKRWVTRLYQSRPRRETAPATLPGRRGGPRILFLTLEMPQWLEAKGWTYSAQAAYAPALREAGATVTVVNSLILDRCRNVLEGKRFDQVWTHLHYRHADGQMFRDWVAETAPVRVGLAGETVHYERVNLASPWEQNHALNYSDWRPILTHAAFGDPADAAWEAEKKDGPEALAWHQGVPRTLVRPVNPSPRFREAVFLGSGYAARDRWLSAPELKGLMRVLPSPEDGTKLPEQFEACHRLIGAWLLSRRRGASLAARLYDWRVSGLRRTATRRFIEALSTGLAVVNFPSMFQGESGRVVEAMASGRPVIAFRGPAAKWSPFTEGEHLLRYETAEELAEKIRRLQTDSVLDVAIAKLARAEVLKRHTVETRAKELLEWVSTA